MCADITAIQHERRRLHAVASCGSRCARAGAATRTAWPTSSPSSADKDACLDRSRVVSSHRSLLGSAPRARAHAPQLEALGLWATLKARQSYKRKRCACSCLALHQHLQGRLLGKRSASGRRRLSGSGGHRHAPRRGHPQACPVGGWLVHGGRDMHAAVKHNRPAAGRGVSIELLGTAGSMPRRRAQDPTPSQCRFARRFPCRGREC